MKNARRTALATALRGSAARRSTAKEPKRLIATVALVVLASAAFPTGVSLAAPPASKLVSITITEPSDGELLTSLALNPLRVNLILKSRALKNAPAAIDLTWHEYAADWSLTYVGSCSLEVSMSRDKSQVIVQALGPGCGNVNTADRYWEILSPNDSDVVGLSFEIYAAMDFWSGPGRHRVEATLTSPALRGAASDVVEFDQIASEQCIEPCATAMCLPWPTGGQQLGDPVCCDDPCWNFFEGGAFCCGFLADGIETVCLQGIGCILPE
jgi:hypothetical protein